MKNKRWRRRSLSLPVLTITRQPSWPLRVLAVLCITGVGAALIWANSVSNVLPGDARKELIRYKGQVDVLEAERERLLAAAHAAESRINMERAVQTQLIAQIKALEAENMRLTEDLGFFEGLLPNAAGPKGISIRRLKLSQIAPGQLRYRLLVVQGGNGAGVFAGNLQLTVSVVHGDGNAMMTFPRASPAEQQKFRLRFRHYQRVEGVLALPEDVIPKSVQARVIENGQLRAQLSENL